VLERVNRIAVAKSLYGGSTAQLKPPRQDPEFTPTGGPWTTPRRVAAARSRTRRSALARRCENPGGNVLDIELAAAVAHEVGAPLIVDNTFAHRRTSATAFEFGAALIIHFRHEILVGNGTTIAGAVVRIGPFEWSNGRFPSIAEPSKRYHGLKFPETSRLRAADEAPIRDAADFGDGDAKFKSECYCSGWRRRGADGTAMSRTRCGRGVAGDGGRRRGAAPALPTAYSQMVERLPAGKAPGSVFASTRERSEGGRRFIEALSLWATSQRRRTLKSLVIHPARRRIGSVGRGVAASGVRARAGAPLWGVEDVDYLVGPFERGWRRPRNRKSWRERAQDRGTIPEIVRGAENRGDRGLSASELRAATSSATTSRARLPLIPSTRKRSACSGRRCIRASATCPST